MVKTNNKKAGFSLAEALVSMLILSIFFVVTSKVVTTRQPDELQGFAHGYYECYQNEDNTYYYKQVNESDVLEENSADFCNYEMPSRTVAQMNIFYYNHDVEQDNRIHMIQENFVNQFNYTVEDIINGYNDDSAINVNCQTFINNLNENCELKNILDSCNFNKEALYIAW